MSFPDRAMEPGHVQLAWNPPLLTATFLLISTLGCCNSCSESCPLDLSRCYKLNICIYPKFIC